MRIRMRLLRSLLRSPHKVLREKVLRGLPGDFFKSPPGSRHQQKPEGHFKSDVFAGSRGGFLQKAPLTPHRDKYQVNIPLFTLLQKTPKPFTKSPPDTRSISLYKAIERWKTKRGIQIGILDLKYPIYPIYGTLNCATPITHSFRTGSRGLMPKPGNWS